MGLTGVAPTTELHRMAYNALQYSGKDTSVKGTTMWLRWGQWLYVFAYDDYFAIEDKVGEIPEASDAEFAFLPLPELQKLEKYLRDVTSPDYSLSEIPFEPSDPANETLRYVADVIETLEGASDAPTGRFAVSPDRLRRLSLLKPKGYPLDFRMTMDEEENPVLAFKYGPDLLGAIAPLNRDTLKEMYKGDELW